VRGILISVLALFTAWVLLAPTGEQALVAGVAVAMLVAAWTLAGHATAGLPALAGSAPVIAARERGRSLATRGTPRLRDPDSAGHTRSRAPSDGIPSLGVPA
jgi:hypothetical protein